jgi:hypothetical protein
VILLLVIMFVENFNTNVIVLSVTS